MSTIRILGDVGSSPSAERLLTFGYYLDWSQKWLAPYDSLTVTLNKRRFNRVVIDPHFEKNHPEMTDPLILELVKCLDQSECEPVAEKVDFIYLAREVRWQ